MAHLSVSSLRLEKDDTEVLTRWRSPEWICRRLLASSSRSRTGCPSRRDPRALASPDGNGSGRPDWRRPARAHARAHGPPKPVPEADVGQAGRHNGAGDPEG